MSTAPRPGRGPSLEEFLRTPGIDDEPPYLEFVDGRVEEKAVPASKHSIITRRLIRRLDEHAEPDGLGAAFPELRCTFAGRSIVPDVAFLLDEHIASDDRGEIIDVEPRVPDIQFEVLSPDQSRPRTHQKLIFSTAHGCPLGVLIDPDRRSVDVYRPGRPPERLAGDGALDLAPVLPGLSIAVGEILGWLVYRRPGPGPS